jgi:hypothetical protein
VGRKVSLQAARLLWPGQLLGETLMLKMQLPDPPEAPKVTKYWNPSGYVSSTQSDLYIFYTVPMAQEWRSPLSPIVQYCL